MVGRGYGWLDNSNEPVKIAMSLARGHRDTNKIPFTTVGKFVLRDRAAWSLDEMDFVITGYDRNVRKSWKQRFLEYLQRNSNFEIIQWNISGQGLRQSVYGGMLQGSFEVVRRWRVERLSDVLFDEDYVFMFEGLLREDPSPFAGRTPLSVKGNYRNVARYQGSLPEKVEL